MFIPPLIIFLNPPLRGLYQDKIKNAYTYKGSERLENLYFVRLGIKFPYQPLLTLQILNLAIEPLYNAVLGCISS